MDPPGLLCNCNRLESIVRHHIDIVAPPEPAWFADSSLGPMRPVAPKTNPATANAFNVGLLLGAV